MCFFSENSVYKRYISNYNISILLKFLVFNATGVTKTVLVLFLTFSNTNWLKKALNFGKMQNTWPPSWISKNGIAQYLWCYKSRATLIKLQKILIN